MLEAFVAALLSFYPKLVEDQAKEHVQAAFAAQAETGIDATLLLGMAFVESRYNPLSLSRIDCVGDDCKRKTGVWTGSEKPKGAKPSWYCGVLQVGGYVPWARCVELRDLTLNYLEGAKHIQEWMDDPYCRKRKGDTKLHCALLGYGGGYQAIKAWKSKYPWKVFRAQRVIQRLVDGKVTS
jgi:hypothetical protein